ncbi:MAG: hypothetical protein A2787_00885 [Omnitrophica WOR_2 bacterium RIFCSPHIGHO2_01_FULL_48_9]|nr:MAG: hypothetical protein A2787_00885 [Omnitrophica WOR_2 bacterium RIFCSPHIGHO2_01_FULL_48_9]
MKTAALIHSQVTPQARRFLHCWVFGIWFLIILRDPFVDLAYLPPEAFQPTGILTIPFSQGYLIQPILWALKIGLLVFLAAAFLNIRFVVTAGVSGLLLTVQQGLIRGFGHVSHGEIVLLLAAYVLSLAAIADAVLYKKSSRVPEGINLNSFPFIGILAVMCFTYAFTGIRRLVYSGLEPYTTDTILAHVLVNSLISDTWSFRMHEFVFSHTWMQLLLKVGFPVITFFEVLAPLCLVSRLFRYAFVIVMLPFHLLSWIFMGVFFWETMVLYMLFFDFSSVLQRNFFMTRQTSPSVV